MNAKSQNRDKHASVSTAMLLLPSLIVGRALPLTASRPAALCSSKVLCTAVARRTSVQVRYFMLLKIACIALRTSRAEVMLPDAGSQLPVSSIGSVALAGAEISHSLTQGHRIQRQCPVQPSKPGQASSEHGGGQRGQQRRHERYRTAR
jgi:hypothetical protein